MNRLDRAALLATLALPVAMLHGRAVAETLLGITIGLFLLDSTLQRRWAWLRTPWLMIGLGWWGWLVACSLPFWPGRTIDSLLQALVAGRYLFLVAALQHFVLRQPAARRWLLRVLDLLAAYIGLHLVAQAMFGVSLYGQPRWAQGELTGPFDRPRAAAPLSRLLFPVLLSALAKVPTWIGITLTAGSISVVALSGQRMPLLLLLFGLLISATMLPMQRRALLASMLIGSVLAAVAATSSPAVATRFGLLVHQVADFRASEYGRIATNAIDLVVQHPATGLGARGFRHICEAVPQDVGCAQHPHNHYLEAAVDAGLPGLALFSMLVVTWLMTLARGLHRHPDPLRVGLFVAVLVQEWPLSSMSNFGSIEFSLPFILLGLGLATGENEEARR